MAKGDIRTYGESSLTGGINDGHNIPITLGASPVSGDIILTFIASPSGDKTVTYTGHTLLATGNSGSYPVVYVYGKLATGSEGTSLAPSFSTQYEGRGGVAVVIEGPFSDLSSVAAYTATRAVTQPSITIPSASQSTTNNATVLAAVVPEANFGPTDWTNSFTNEILADTNDSSYLAVTSRQYSSGALGISTVANFAANRILGGALVKVEFTAGDTTPPTLSAPVGSATSSTAATVGATTDEGNGTLYAVVTGSATQPSVAQIKAGNDHTGSAAAWSGNVAVSSTGAKTLNATGLTSGSSYYVHLVHTDAAANDSNSVTSSQWTQLVRKVKLKLDIAAAGEVVSGAVWADSPGSITGDKFGEFTGQTIGTGSGADAGLAVLKVPVSVFGGGSLSVGDTVQVYVRKPDLSKDSDVFPATVIEE